MNKIRINNLKKLKVLALTGLVLIRNDVITQALDNDLQVGIEYEVHGNPEYSLRLNEVLEDLDENIKKYMKESNVKVVILDGEDAAEEIFLQLRGYNSGHVTGFLDDSSDSKCIYVEGSKHKDYYDKYPDSSKGLTEDEFNFRIVRGTLLYEIGNFLNGGLDEKLSKRKKFQEIYYEEVNNFKNTLEFKIDNFGISANISDPATYFSNAFACYISYPDSLKENCPRTYKFIKKVIKKEKYKEDNIAEEEFDNYELNIGFEKWGNPIYADRLKYDLAHMNKGLLKYFEDIGLRIIVLEGSKDAENLYSQMFDYYYSSIRGFPTLDYREIYVEGCLMPGYYEKYSDCSKGFTEDEFNYRIVRDTLYHEMAHCMDGGYSQYISGSAEFQSII